MLQKNAMGVGKNDEFYEKLFRFLCLNQSLLYESREGTWVKCDGKIYHVEFDSEF
jgi:hypothetical protein